MTAKKKAAKKPTKRSAASGRFGNGEREAEALARLIIEIADDEITFPVSGVVESRLLERIKAELLAATVVEERAVEVLWEGHAVVYTMSTSKHYLPKLMKTQAEAREYNRSGAVVERAEAVAPVRRKPVPATPPKAAAKKSGGRRK